MQVIQLFFYLAYWFQSGKTVPGSKRPISTSLSAVRLCCAFIDTEKNIECSLINQIVYIASGFLVRPSAPQTKL